MFISTHRFITMNMVVLVCRVYHCFSVVTLRTCCDDHKILVHLVSDLLSDINSVVNILFMDPRMELYYNINSVVPR